MNTAAEYDNYVSQLRAANVGEEAAHKAARIKYPDAAAQKAAMAERASDELERVEQWEITKLYRTFRFDVYSTSQYRRAKITPGVPDLWVMHTELPIAFWHEVKRSKGGRFSEPQIRFREQAQRAGVGYISGDRYAARTHLITLGLAQIIGDAIEPVRTPA